MGAGARGAATRSRGLRSGLVLALGVGTLAVFAAAPGHGFLEFDDRRYIVDNPWIREGLGLDTLRFAFGGFHFSNWHPLTWLSFALDVELFGLEPAGFHVENVLLHLLNVWLVFALLERTTGAAWPSAAAAALFAWHPLHVEPVAWISERKELLAALFGLLSVAAYVRWVRRGGAGRYAAVAALMALSLLAKPMWVTLPLLLLVLDHWPLGRLAGAFGARVREKLPLAALSLGSAAITLAAQRSAMATAGAVALPERVANAAVASVAYLAKTLWPADLSLLYPHPYLPGGVPPAPWQVLGAMALLLALALAALRLRDRPWLAAGLAWYAIALLPVIGLVQVGEQAMADRYTYVPLLGIFWILAFAARDAVAAIRRRSPAAAGAAALVLAALLVACAVRAAEQVGAWRDTVTLYRRSLEATPNSAVLHYNLGNRLLARGEAGAARPHYESALRLRPDWDLPAVSLAWLLATSADPSLRDPARALQLASRAATATGLGDANTLDTLAAAQAASGAFERAAETARRAAARAVETGHPSQARAFEARRRLYARGLPYVEPAPARETSNSSVR